MIHYATTGRFEEFVTPHISNLIEEQFPGWYQEKGPQFVAFVRAYYEWMEQAGHTLYYSRHYYNIKDIDNTLDEFVIYFKEKYLKNIQLDTRTDTRTLIKHALDIYRSKGTPRCIELLFHLVYGEDVELYYPGTDLFKLSDGVWYRPTYLELSLQENNIDLVHKEIQGVSSRAVGYVDSIVRRMTQGRLQDIAYISAISGNFRTGEKIQPTDLSIPLLRCPRISGSLTSITISDIGTGQGYANGDVVDISSIYGTGGKGRVVETIDQFGQIAVELIGGGYGFNSDATIHISNAMLYVANVTLNNPQYIDYFRFHDMLSQEQSWLNYEGASAPFQLGEEVFTYTGANEVMGHGIILQKSQVTANDGAILVGIISGDMANTIYTTGNVVNAPLALANGVWSANATGMLIANDHNMTISINSISGAFIAGELVYQGGYAYGYVEESSNTTVVVNNMVRAFRRGGVLRGSVSRATANIESVGFTIGLCNTENVFYVYDNNTVTCNGFTATIERIEQGSGLEILITNSYSYTETVGISNDAITDFLSVELDAASYGFSANASANLTTCTLDECLTYANVTIGKATGLVVSNTGSDYSHESFIVVDQEVISHLDHRDLILFLEGSSYGVGDFLQQTATGARGIVKATNTTAVFVENLRINKDDQFMISNSTSNTQIYSQQGLTANIVAIDYDSVVTGRNMTFNREFSVGNGAILTLEVVDSGFGFMEAESILLGNNNGRATTSVTTQGRGTGYYKVKGGFLSDQKKLFDGWYWQNYSYEVQSALMLSKYYDMLKQITHIAGTIMFGKIKYKNQDNSSLTSETAVITIS